MFKFFDDMGSSIARLMESRFKTHQYNLVIADRRKPTIEFYDFLQVNSDNSNRNEVIEHAKKLDDEDVEQELVAVQNQTKEAAAVQFINFLSVQRDS